MKKIYKKVVLSAAVIAAFLTFAFVSCEGMDNLPQETYPEKDGGLITYTARSSGSGSAAKINFTFSAAVSGLMPADITFNVVSGAATRSDLTGLNGSGKRWSMDINVTAEGLASVSVKKAGIKEAAKNVTLHLYPPDGSITYTIEADGNPAVPSSKIDFEFDTDIRGLDFKVEDIIIGSMPGGADKGALTMTDDGTGTRWSLAITPTSDGVTGVTIVKTGIDRRMQAAILYMGGGVITYTAAADGNGNTATTNIGLVFNADVDSFNLTAADITIAGGPGAATAGSLTGSGRNWNLGITAVTAGGAAAVSIVKSGVETGLKGITLWTGTESSTGGGAITYTAKADGNSTEASTKIDFEFDADVPVLTPADITLTGGTGSATKGGISGGGRNWSMAVTAVTEGWAAVSVSATGVETGTKGITLYDGAGGPTPTPTPTPTTSATPTPTPTATPPTPGDGTTAGTAKAVSAAGSDNRYTKLTFTWNISGKSLEYAVVANGAIPALWTDTPASGTQTGDVAASAAADDVYVRVKASAVKLLDSVTLGAVPVVATPTASPGAGAVYSGTTVTLTTATSSASIYYTTNGDTPTTSSTAYSSPIPITAATTIKAIAVKTDMTNSAVMSAAYTIKAPTAYTAVANGSATATSTKIDFVFTAAVTGLTAADIAIGGSPGAATKGALTGSGTAWSLALTAVSTAGAATVTISKSGIDSGARSITLYKSTIVNAASPDLSIKFGITTTGTTTVQHVTATFNAVHAYLAKNPAVTATTTASADMPAGLATKIGDIALGDYIDLVSLSIVAYPAGGEGALNNLTNKTLLRLIVVGINSFHSQGTYAIGGAAQAYNDAAPHLVFQFQNSPVLHRMNDTGTGSAGGYAASEMRKYLVNVGGSGGNFLTGLISAGVPDAVLWAPKRYVANGGSSATAADELEDKLWLPTEREMFGYKTWSTAYETETNQARLAYYTSDAIRIKSNAGGPFRHGLASPCRSSMSGFCVVTKGGYSNLGDNAGIECGAAPAFCVK